MNLPPADQEFEALLNYLKRNRGCDLTGYKRSTLQRRFTHRMQSINIFNYQDYLHHLQNFDQEYVALLDDVLINVTSFFRDRNTWDYLANDIIPRIIASKPDQKIRVWSAACASGEEVYSLVILFAQALGIELCLQQVQFYATDVDRAALQQARYGTYSAKEVAEIPPDLLEKYFEQTSQDGFVFDRKLRSTIVFGDHNLAEDAPMSKIDLLMCRNALMYFNVETQASILVRFHFALSNNGFLCLGKSETLTSRKQIFTPVNFKHRIYTKGSNLDLTDHLLIKPKSAHQPVLDPTTIQNQVWQTAYLASSLAQLAIDVNGRLVVANAQASTLFGLTPDDWSRPFAELEPGKLIGDRAATRMFYRRRSITLKNIEWIAANGTKYFFDATITPIFNQRQHLLGVNVTFIDVSDRQQLAAKLELANSELSRVSETLAQTKAALDLTQKE